MDARDTSSASATGRRDPSLGTSRGLAVGLKILNHLGAEGRTFSLRELAAFTSLGKPSLLRLLRTLESMGYISRDGRRGYRLEVETSVARAHDGLRVLRPAWAHLAPELQSRCGETVSIAYLFEDHIRVVHVLESSQHIRMTNFVGRILQPYASSLGKAITAFQEEARVQNLLDVYGIYRSTQHTLTDQLAIQNEFAEVRSRGYAEDREETVEGGYCIGAPIRDTQGRVIAALSVSSPKFRVTQQFKERFSARLIETAQQMSAIAFSAD